MSSLRAWGVTSAMGIATVITLVVSTTSSGCSSSETGAPTPLLTGTDGSTPGTKTPRGEDAGAGADATPASPYDAGSLQPAIDTLCAAAKQLGTSAAQVIESGPEYTPTGGSVVAATYTLGGLYSYRGGILDGGTSGDDSGDDDDDDGGEDPLPDASSVSDGSTGDNGPPSASMGTAVEEKTLVLEESGLFSLASAAGTVDAGLGATTISAGVYQVSGDTITFHGTCPSSSDSSYSFSASGGVLALYEPGGVVEIFRQVAEP